MTEKRKFPTAQQAVPARRLPAMPDGWTSLTTAFFRTARQNKDKVFGIDADGSITFGELLEKSVAVSCVLQRKLGEAANVGLIIPPSVGGALANVAVTILGKTAVNLSYAIKSEAINALIAKAGITHVIVSRAAMEKFKFQLNAEIIYLDDVKEKVTGSDKMFTALVARYTPLWMLGLFLAGASSKPKDTATIMFTSGSTGDPKGVLLSHSNILSNLLQVTEHADVSSDEVILGMLPFFHSFGFTVTLWTALVLGKTVVYYPNPLDVRNIGKLIEDHKVTLMACTPTLMRGFVKRCTAQQFASVRNLLLGAEKLKPELAADIEKTLGKKPVEVFGSSECSPGISANVDRLVRTPDGRTVHGNKPGSVGQPIPGTTIVILDLKTGALLPPGKELEGLIFVHGPQVMQGYLNLPEQTADVLQNGWYCTGDIGKIDADGFLWITDRLSRFAKVGGEMVPLIKVENAIRAITQTDELTVVATAIPDETKGERVVIVYTPEMGMSPADVCTALSAGQLPQLWLPRANDFVSIVEMPKGPTGKLDLKQVKQVALDKLGNQ